MVGALLLGCSAATASAAAYLVSVAIVAHRFTTPRRTTVSTTPSPSAGACHRVEFPSREDALPIAAWFHEVPSAQAAVILVHGRNSCRDDVIPGHTDALAARIAACGMSVLSIDLRGHGDSGQARLTFGQHERRDVLGAVDFLLGRGHVANRIGVFGASMGGASAIAAAADDAAIGALITDSAFADLDPVLRAQFRRLTRLPVCCLRGALCVARVMTGTWLTARAPDQLMRALRDRPVLIIHAAGDAFVPVQHAHRLAAAGGAQLWITPGVRHLASAAAIGSHYADVVAGFFASALLGRRVADRDVRTVPATAVRSRVRTPLTA